MYTLYEYYLLDRLHTEKSQRGKYTVINSWSGSRYVGFLESFIIIVFRLSIFCLSAVLGQCYCVLMKKK